MRGCLRWLSTAATLRPYCTLARTRKGNGVDELLICTVGVYSGSGQGPLKAKFKRTKVTAYMTRVDARSAYNTKKRVGISNALYFPRLSGHGHAHRDHSAILLSTLLLSLLLLFSSFDINLLAIMATRAPFQA